MAKLAGDIQFTGSLQNLSFYKMRGCDKIVVRKKGGPTRKQIKRSPNFELTRRNNQEFGGRAKAAKFIKDALHPLLFLADYNITAPLNALLSPIQKMDVTSVQGERNILISKNPTLLQGFTLNRKYLFESIVKTPVSYIIQDQQVIMNIPDLLPGINFMAPVNYPWYRFFAVAGVVPDICYQGERHGYQPKSNSYGAYTASTNWLPLNTPAAATKLTVTGLPANKPDDCSLIMALGIGFGTMQGGDITPVRYIGAGRVIGVQ